MPTKTERPDTSIQQPPLLSKYSVNKVGSNFFILSIVIGIMTMILTSILMSKDIAKKYKFSLIMALIGSLCPITLLLLLIVLNYFGINIKLMIGQIGEMILILFFLAAAICLQITSLVIKPQKVESYKGLSMTIQVFVYLGIIVEILASIIGVIGYVL